MLPFPLPSPSLQSDVSAQGEHSRPEASPLAQRPFPSFKWRGKGTEREAYLGNIQTHE